MKAEDLITILSSKIDAKLSHDLVHEFIQIKLDFVTSTLGRASVGKFIETVVQVLQFLDTGKYDSKPDVDKYLSGLESRQANFDDGLRICCSRYARACYTLRNKRNILHKGDVDPNIYDLKLSFYSAQWILTEVIRQVTAASMKASGSLVEYIQLPVTELVEEIDGKKLVHGKDLSAEEEALVLLHSFYPKSVSRSEIGKGLDRRATSSISNAITKLWNGKFVEKLNDGSYKLTLTGYNRSQSIIGKTQML